MMATILQSPTLHLNSLGIINSSSSPSKRRKQRQLQKQEKYKRQQFNQSNNSFSLSYPKSYPTPLLIHHQSPIPQTKLQALDSVIGELEKAVENHVKIQTEIFASLLETCYRLKAIDQGVRVHRVIPTNLLRNNVGLSSKLLRLYSVGGRLDDAHQVFDEMSKRDFYAFPWNALMAGYTELGLYEDALALYFQMEEEEVQPDCFTFPRVLKSCGGIGSVRIGEAVHRHLVRSGFGKDEFVINALVDMYAKCGDIVKARRVFNMIECKDLVSWNTMLTGYARHGLLVEAQEIFIRMVKEGFQPDSITISALIASKSSLEILVQLHGWAIRRGTEWNLSTANALIAAYANHGKLEQARWLFDEMPERDIISWNSIISAHSKDPRVVQYYREMEDAGTLPDAITFVSLLSACAHLGLVKLGERLFWSMTEKYGIKPVLEHYACMVNLYARAGMIDQAYAIIKREMQLEAGSTAWGALLYACYLHKNVHIGEIAAEKLFELEPDNQHNFELLIKIYKNRGRSEDADRVRKMMLDRGLGEHE